jgi:uncharacterized FlgJ-related protein
MLYKYDRNQLMYKKDTTILKLFILVLIILSITSFLFGRYAKFELLDNYEKELIVLNLREEEGKFTEDKFIALLTELNVKFPHIVMAQSMVETGYWKSKIFKENHNLFGMKQARVRINTAGGTHNGHAYYNNWIESVYDYAFYQCRYMSTIKTEAEYFYYLSKTYAEDESYIYKLKSIISKNNLKQHFE